MISVLFNRKQRTLEWPVPGGRRVIEAFSEVRNELNGERPDLARLPDTETGVSAGLTTGPVVMPRPFPVGTWSIYAAEATENKWMNPVKIKTRSTQLVPVWSVKLDGSYDKPTGTMFSDWGYWIHYANGSHHTDGCIGVVSLEDFKEFLGMVRNALAEGIPIQVTVVAE